MRPQGCGPKVRRKPLGSGLRRCKPRAEPQSETCFNAYAKAVNKAYGRTGSLFENPFGRKALTSDAYLIQLIAYIHRHPQKHGFCRDDYHESGSLFLSRHASTESNARFSGMRCWVGSMGWLIPGYPLPGGRISP